MKLKLKNDKNQNRHRVIPVICPDAGGAPRIPTVFPIGNEINTKNTKNQNGDDVAYRYAAHRPRELGDLRGNKNKIKHDEKPEWPSGDAGHRPRGGLRSAHPRGDRGGKWKLILKL